MTELTSLADLHFRISKDERYKKLAIRAYRDSRYCPWNWEEDFNSAINWIDSWNQNNKQNQIVKEGHTPTCQEMINFLNRIMDRMGIFHGTPTIIPTNTTENVS